MVGALPQSPVVSTAPVSSENGELWVRRKTAHRASVSSAANRGSGGFIGLRRKHSADSRVRYGAGVLGPAIATPSSRKTTTVSSVERVTEEAREASSWLSPDEDAGPPSNGSVPNFLSKRTPSDGQSVFSPAEMQPWSKNGSEDGPIPLSVVRNRERIGSSRSVLIDRWVPAGSKLYQVKQLLDRLEDAEASDEGVRAAMEGWESPISPRDITSVISSLKWKTALPFFGWLKAQGYELNVVAYNVLLGTFRAGRAWDMADEFAQQMLADGIKLDNYTYSTLISCALQCNAPMDALKWFEKMPETGCVPDEVTYSNMALVYSRLGRFNDAVELYESLRATGWKPDKISFGTLVNVYGRAGNYFKAAAVIREMQEAGQKPEAVVYNTLIRFFAREGKTGQAKRVFHDMEGAGVRPTEYTLSLMIDVHGRAGETKEAFQLFTRLKEEKLPLDVVVYNSLLKMCAEERLVREGENLLAGMVGRGLKPDTVTYKSVINLYAKEGRIKDAEKFANRMVEVGFPLDVVVYSCLMKACGISKDFKRAETYFHRMLADECRVDDKCCGVLLSLMTMCEIEEDRSVVFGCLQKSKPTLTGVLSLLQAEDLHRSELEEKVKILLSDSEPDSHRPFCNALVDICWGLEKREHAGELLSLADSLKVYPGGLRTKSTQVWILHLRSLSFNAAECALHSWIDYLREKVKQGEALPETLALETGAGRNRDDVTRLFNVILSKLKDMAAPFEPSDDRTDWLVSTGSACTSWLAVPVPSEVVPSDLEL